MNDVRGRVARVVVAVVLLAVVIAGCADGGDTSRQSVIGQPGGGEEPERVEPTSASEGPPVVAPTTLPELPRPTRELTPSTTRPDGSLSDCYVGPFEFNVPPDWAFNTEEPDSGMHSCKIFVPVENTGGRRPDPPLDIGALLAAVPDSGGDEDLNVPLLASLGGPSPGVGMEEVLEIMLWEVLDDARSTSRFSREAATITLMPPDPAIDLREVRRSDGNGPTSATVIRVSSIRYRSEDDQTGEQVERLVAVLPDGSALILGTVSYSKGATPERVGILFDTIAESLVIR